jgi:hypothetical protein
MSVEKEDVDLGENEQLPRSPIDKQEENSSVELGDMVYIEGGKHDQLYGRVYYIDETLMRVLPTGVSDRLVDIPLIDDEFDPDLGVKNCYIDVKRTNPAFVAQIDAHAGGNVETFTETGEEGPTYSIIAVDEKGDKITLQPKVSAEPPLEILFENKGIPRDLPFSVMRVRDVEEEIVDEEEEDVNEEVIREEDEEEEEDLDKVIEESRRQQATRFVEVPLIERIYPDSTQKGEMLYDMVGMERIEARSNPDVQRKINTLVDQMILLRNSVVYYHPKTGKPVGLLPTSFPLISNLLASVSVPLMRPVMKVKRTLYLDHTPDETEDTTEIPDADIDIQYLSDAVKQTTEYMNTQLGGNAGNQDLPNWFTSWETLHSYHRSWAPYISTEKENTSFSRDTEFLRAPIPESDTPVVDGLPKLDADISMLVTSEVITKIHSGILRGLGPRSTRLHPKDPNERRVENPEEATIVNTLIFPLSVQAHLGTIRSGRVANDIANSHMPMLSFNDIIVRLNGIPDKPNAGGIVSIGEGGNTNGSIPLESWLVNQSLYPLGLGDAVVELANYGLSQTEFNKEQQEVLITKIDMYRALIKQYIIELRAASEKAMSDMTTKENNFLDEKGYADMLGLVNGEPILKEEEKSFLSAIPVYKNNDVALFAYLWSKSADLLLATMSQVPFPLARERNRKVRDQFLEALKDALQKTMKREMAGEPPTPNKCPHVESYTQIKRVKDDTERMMLFSKYLAKFKKGRSEKWLECSLCNQHLACYHEFLLLQEFLHPREKATIHKEIVLEYNGGQFCGKYICNNCGQPISELDFDKSIEYSDDGVPMSGRAAMNTEDEELEEQLDAVLSETKEDELVFDKENLNMYYQTARRIFDMVGIQPDKKCYKRIAERVDGEMMRQPNKEEYKKLAGARKVLDYTTNYNQIIVCATAINCLIEIQTSIPGYVMRYKMDGCKAGFSGIPIGTDETDLTGIEYIACAVSRVNDTEKQPWSNTDWMRQTESKRQETILMRMKHSLKGLLTQTSIQQQIALKRAQLKEIYGDIKYADQLPEKIPEGFAPFPYTDTSKEIIVPEAASEKQAVQAWILQAHRLAKENGNYIRGDRLSEATCCFIPIQEPGKFWKEQENAMAKLPLKQPPRGPILSHLAIPFEPRPIQDMNVEIPPDVRYKIFLNVCYEGPKMGLRHEPGYTNKCMNCGFEFPESPYILQPSMPLTRELIKQYNEETAASITAGKVALETQDVKITDITFQELIDSSHKAFQVKPSQKREIMTGIKLLEELQNFDAFEGWKEQITDTIAEISKLPEKPDEVELTGAYGSMSNLAREIMDYFLAKLGQTRANILERLLKSTPEQIVEFVRTYFVVQFQRLKYKFKNDNLRIRIVDVGQSTRDTIDEMIKKHTSFKTDLASRIRGGTLEKLDIVIERMNRALNILKVHMRASSFPGGGVGLPYIMTALVGGILREFIDPDVGPKDDMWLKGPLTIVDSCILKIHEEALNFTGEQIRELIQKRSEDEKNLFIRRFEGKTQAEKNMEKMYKKLGLGEWAITSKDVRKYSPEQWEKDREQRRQMGFTEFQPEALEAGPEGLEPGQEDGYDIGEEVDD